MRMERKQMRSQTLHALRSPCFRHVDEFTMDFESIPFEMFLQCPQIAKPKILSRLGVAVTYEKSRTNTVPPQNGCGDGRIVSITIVERQNDARLSARRSVSRRI